jgi:hypothetical protein
MGKEEGAILILSYACSGRKGGKERGKGREREREREREIERLRERFVGQSQSL